MYKTHLPAIIMLLFSRKWLFTFALFIRKYSNSNMIIAVFVYAYRPERMAHPHGHLMMLAMVQIHWQSVNSDIQGQGNPNPV